MAQAREKAKYREYISSKVLPNNEPAISVSDRGVLHVDPTFVLNSKTGSTQVAASIRLKKSFEKRKKR